MPAPPPGKTGWPWTIEGAPPKSFNGEHEILPKISVVTPSLNQAEFLEETIRSVLLQNYPNLEYLVIDGGSSDGSVEIIQKYDRWINLWESEPDRGQAHAINKGFDRSTGQWLTWLNSDDLLLPGSLWSVAKAITENPMIDWTVGTVIVTNQDMEPIRKFLPVCKTDDWTDFLCNKRPSGTSIPQPGACWSREAWSKCGELDETLRYVMDYEYWARLAKHGYRPMVLPDELALFRLSAGSKSGSGMVKFIREEQSVVAKYLAVGQIDQPLKVWLYKVFLRQIWSYRMSSNRLKGTFHKFCSHLKQ